MFGPVKDIGGSSWVPSIGFVWKSANPTCPAELYDNTVWAQIKDRAVLASGDTYTNGTVGGSSNIALTTAELPSHAHSGNTSVNGTHTHTVKVMYISGSDAFICKYDENKFNNKTVTSSTDGAHTHTVTVGSTGSGTAFNILMPYVVRYMWERIG